MTAPLQSPRDLTHTPPSWLLGTARAWWAPRLRRLAERLLAHTQCGQLSLRLPDGQRIDGRGSLPGPHASLTLHRWRALARLALKGDLGLAEAYRDGDWSTPDLTALLECGLRNEAGWRDAFEPKGLARLLLRGVHQARANTRRGSRRNISFHYDLGNAFYAEWLDPELIYSSALYSDATPDLEAAQSAKLRRITELLQLDSLPADGRILEIGCGWGALACTLARAHPARLTGLTLSTEQLAHARERAAAEGLAEQLDLRLQDYRDVEGRYDRIVSIEMLEAVGEAYWPVYFETLRQRLKPGGRAVIQVITIADEHFEHYRQGTDFIQRHIFPGGMLPSPSVLQREAERAGLALAGAETFGASYARTLVDWRQRFLAAWPAIAAQGFDNRFRRLWEYYLSYCEAGFRTGRVDVGLYTLVHHDAPA